MAQCTAQASEVKMPSELRFILNEVFKIEHEGSQLQQSCKMFHIMF